VIWSSRKETLVRVAFASSASTAMGRGGSPVQTPGVSRATLSVAKEVYFAAAKGTTLAPFFGVAVQNFAQASINCRRFWNRSPWR